MATAIGSRVRWTARASAYEVVDIEQHPEAAELVEKVNNGNQTVPTLVYADGTAQTNPSVIQVKEKLAALASGERAARRADRCGRPTRLAGRSSSLYQEPGSGPPYQSSTSDRLIETPPGSTSVPACGLSTHRRRG